MPASRIKFQCPTCEAVISAKAKAAGNKVHCPKCSQRLLVPKPERAKTILATLVSSLPMRPRPESPSLLDFEDDEPARIEDVEPHRGFGILALGIVGLFIPFVAFVAWDLGHKDLEMMRRGLMDRAGKGYTEIGRLLGKIVGMAYLIGVAVVAVGFLLLILISLIPRFR